MIKGDVVDDQTGAFYNFFGMPAAYPSAVADVLNSGATTDDVEVDVASNGGDVFAASEIYTLLKGYQGNVTVNIQGLAASAASVIAMAGDKVSISPTAQIMIHQAWASVNGNADDLTHQAAVLDGVDKSIVAAYSDKSGMDSDDVLQLMANETWMTAQDAVDKGFADEIMFVDDKQPQFTNSVSSIPSKSAVNKFMNLLSTAKSKSESQQTEQPQKSQPTTLMQSKLAILMGKNNEEAN
ncbi:head maturation protease, ClpP-related [Levilactobacillus brevis]